MKTPIDWKSKLSSRKFWVAVIGFVTTILVMFGVPNPTIEQIIACITACSTLVAYIIAEGMVDASKVRAEIEKKSADVDGSK
jgi:uncharacterized membrane protein